MDFERLKNLLDEHKYVDFMKELDGMNAVDAAEFITSVDENDLPKVFRMLKKNAAADVFAELDSNVQEKLISAMSDKEIFKIVDQLYMDDTVDMLEELPANVVNRILKNTSSQTRAEINKFLKYPEDSAGSVMTSEFVSVHSAMTVSEAIEYIRKTGVDKETVYIIYVTNKSRVLKGIIELSDLLFSAPDAKIADIMDTSIVSALTTDDQETAASLISKYDLLALPITDSENRLVGIVTVDDALDVIETEATEDIEKMAAIVPTEKPYLKSGVFETWKKRIPWLLLLMVSATFTGSIITHYENALGQLVVLTAFIPMLMDTGGNAGGQASVTVIRGLSLGEIKMSNILRVLWKEFRVSILCGVTLGVAVFAKCMLIDRVSPMISLVVSVTLISTVVIAKMVGCSLPILAKRIGFDPAVMASPFITTIVDAVSLLIYFKIASFILGI